MLNFGLSEEQQALVQSARRFAEERIIPVAAEADKNAEFPRKVFEEAWQLGLVNPTVAEAYGGAGLSHLDNSLICEQLAFGCTGIQTSMLANTGTHPDSTRRQRAAKSKILGHAYRQP